MATGSELIPRAVQVSLDAVELIDLLNQGARDRIALFLRGNYTREHGYVLTIEGVLYTDIGHHICTRAVHLSELVACGNAMEAIRNAVAAVIDGLKRKV
jgi:hypothetical protein